MPIQRKTRSTNPTTPGIVMIVLDESVTDEAAEKLLDSMTEVTKQFSGLDLKFAIEAVASNGAAAEADVDEDEDEDVEEEEAEEEAEAETEDELYSEDELNEMDIEDLRGIADEWGLSYNPRSKKIGLVRIILEAQEEEAEEE